MSYTESVISGIIQGLTEFLPVSSSGHLVILHHLFGIREPQLLFDIFLHIGTIFAVLAYFWYDIIKMFTKELRLLGFVIAGSFITAAIGFAFKSLFEGFFTNIKVVGLMLFVTAGFLFAAEFISANKNRAYTGLSWLKAIIIGLVQAVAIMPGISRSGSTISTGLMLGLGKKEAVKFSFLLSVPAVFGAAILKFAEAKGTAIFAPQFFAGALCAFISGIVAIKILIKAVESLKLKFFSVYCVIIGLIALIF